MGPYTVIYSDKAEKFLEKLDDKNYERIKEKIKLLAVDPYARNLDTKKLKKELKQYRLRVGDYRVIYEIENNQLLILILDVGHRKDIYD